MIAPLSLRSVHRDFVVTSTLGRDLRLHEALKATDESSRMLTKPVTVMDSANPIGGQTTSSSVSTLLVPSVTTTLTRSEERRVGKEC